MSGPRIVQHADDCDCPSCAMTLGARFVAACCGWHRARRHATEARIDLARHLHSEHGIEVAATSLPICASATEPDPEPALVPLFAPSPPEETA